MKRSILQIYATVICIVAVISFLISIANVVDSFTDYLDPLNSRRNQVNLSSFEYFKMDLLKTTTKEQYYIPNDQEIQNMYSAAKEQHISNVLHNIHSDLIVSTFITVLSIILFFTHWKIVKKHESVVKA